ncbi:hypothetical protein [Streptomyces sp. NPDC005533]|uniref:hypothetical protein n=1 Tax=Streptomyces sp. NPDC005533 TaxID=3364723 RepID=UPI0036800C9F
MRAAALEPGRRVTGTYTVLPPHAAQTPPPSYEEPQFRLRPTTHGMPLWVARRHGVG